MKNAVLLSLCALALTSCSKSDKEVAVSAPAKCQNGTFQVRNQNGIIGGSVVPEETWLAHQTVFLLNISDKSMSACTGVLIDSKIVLTAAHCMDPAPLSVASTTYVVFSAQPECDSDKDTLKSRVSAVDRVIVHPLWKKGAENRGDLAMIRLASAAPAPWKPAHLVNEYADPRRQPNLVAGYGSDGGYGVESIMLLRATWLDGLRDSTRARALAVLSRNGEDSRKLEDYLSMGADKEYLFFDQADGRGVCSGDSGGASYAQKNGRYDVTGIASFVRNTDSQMPSAACGMIGAHSSVIFYRQWIEETFQSLRDFGSTKKSAFE